MKQLFLSISLALLAFTSCKKDKDNTPSKEPEELILGDWQVTSASLSPAVDWFSDGDTTTDAFTKEKPCRKDDYVTFKSNGTFEINEGATKCNSGDDQITYSTYTLSYPYISFDNLTTAKIEQLDNSTLKMSTDIEMLDGNVTLTQTLKRK